MGREPVGARQHILFHLAVGLTGLLLIGGCGHDQVAVTPIESRLQQVETCRRQSDFACAEALLAPSRDRQAAPAGPRILYLAGLVAADTRNPDRNLTIAWAYFQRIVEAYPASPLAIDAAAWIGLLDELDTREEALAELQSVNDRLQQEIKAHKADLRRKAKRLDRLEKRLERLKAVDLSLE